MSESYLNGRLRSFGHAIRGLKVMLQSQQNARIHALATVLVVLAGVIVRLTAAEWSLVVLAIAGVWATEAINTAIESLVDLSSPERHPLAAKAKDVAAGAVLVAAIGSVAIGGLVFGPHLLRLLGK